MKSLSLQEMNGAPFSTFLQKSWPQQGRLAAFQSLSSASIKELNLSVVGDDLPYPLAVLRESALVHNIRWMQDYAERRGVVLAPHGKTTMAPQLFDMQLKCGAWGMTFANVSQMAVGLHSGVRRVVIANQVLAVADLNALLAWQVQLPDLEVAFLVDSLAQLDVIEQWHRSLKVPHAMDVLLEVGFAGGRTGCRTLEQAMILAQAINRSPALQLRGIECYEGPLATCSRDQDPLVVTQFVQTVQTVTREVDRLQLFSGPDIWITAGGSAVFDLVLPLLRMSALCLPVLGILRSGCTVTHDHWHYARYLDLVAERENLGCTLQAALEVWTLVQSVPEPGLALLNAGRRDLSFDIAMPVPVRHIPLAQCGPCALAPDLAITPNLPQDWHISALNDHHAFLRFDPSGLTPQVGDRVALGISHPCTTFDKWTWLALVNDQGQVQDVVTTWF
jgi:D-serine dehydratase